jgi:cystathionine beta-lyase/cystathionine gamma-synthase
MRAQDLDMLREVVAGAVARAPGIRLIIDSTIATLWLQAAAVEARRGRGRERTKALGGTDRDLWGYIATDDVQLANGVMDLMAMRGGILDWRRAEAIVQTWDQAEPAHARRCETAERVAAFLAAHPRVSEVFHPSRPSHPDAAAIAKHYVRHGSLLSFRVAGADEAYTRHVADVLATTVIVRYALSFDGLATKVNHHQTVSESFHGRPQLVRNGFDRLIRLAVGLEDADDLIAALNWTLHHADKISVADLEAWQQQRIASLGVK